LEEKKQINEPLWVRTINKLTEVSGFLSAMLILISSLIVVQQVTVRLFGKSTIWQTEMTIYLLMFTTFVGSAYTLKHDGHVGVDVITQLLSKKAQHIVKIITSLLSISVVVIVAWKAWGLWYEATSHGWVSETIWGPPLSIPYFLLPLGMTLTGLQFLVVIWEEVQKIKQINANSNT
jgi:TRAP-type C4-dicarboxylate transport system permease small subunit